MHFGAEHRFTAPAAAVMAAMVDPGLHAALRLPDVAPPELLGVEATAGATTLRLRYTFTGRLDPVARRIVGDGRLSWVQEIEVRPAELAGRLAFASEDRARRLHGEAVLAFAQDGTGTTRTVDGELAVDVRLVRAVAERSIVSGVLGRLDLEAGAVRARLAAAGPGA